MKMFILENFSSAGVFFNCTLILYGTTTDPLRDNTHVPSPPPIFTKGSSPTQPHTSSSTNKPEGDVRSIVSFPQP